MKKSNIMATALCAAAVAAAGQDAAPAEEESASFSLLSAAKELELSATLEVTAGWTKQGDDKDFDVNFDTAEIDLGGARQATGLRISTGGKGTFDVFVR